MFLFDFFFLSFLEPEELVPFAAWGAASYGSFLSNDLLWDALTSSELFLQAGNALLSPYMCFTPALLYLEAQNQLLQQKKELIRLIYT